MVIIIRDAHYVFVVIGGGLNVEFFVSDGLKGKQRFFLRLYLEVGRKPPTPEILDILQLKIKDTSMLILDLDDTIFETKSMNPKIFDSAISLIENYYQQNDSKVKSEEIIADLWSFPIDIVFEKYNIQKSLISEFYKRIEEINFQELDIKTFEDYKEIRTFTQKKILVTTGLQKLQWAKIKALGIENDFDDIYIDDICLIPRKYKIDIFRQILLDTKKEPQAIWVIGDNPESEIRYGKELGMKTIQRKSKSKVFSELADYKIESFEELKKIIN